METGRYLLVAPAGAVSPGSGCWPHIFRESQGLCRRRPKTEGPLGRRAGLRLAHALPAQLRQLV